MANKIRGRTLWAPSELNALKQASRYGWGAARLAKKIKRSEGACRQQALAQGLPLRKAA
jgi:hypothetical protein